MLLCFMNFEHVDSTGDDSGDMPWVTEERSGIIRRAN